MAKDYAVDLICQHHGVQSESMVIVSDSREDEEWAKKCGVDSYLIQ